MPNLVGEEKQTVNPIKIIGGLLVLFGFVFRAITGERDDPGQCDERDI